jgi:hypothetical protein
MACIITNGIARNCDFAVGGIKGSIWIANSEDITALAYSTAGQITGATMASGTTFYEFQPELQTAGLTQSLNAGQVSKFVSQVLVFSLASLTQAKVETLNSLALGTTQVVFESNDGSVYWVGDDGSNLKCTALEVVTGATDTDNAMATVTLTASNKGYAPTVAPALLASLGITI